MNFRSMNSDQVVYSSPVPQVQPAPHPQAEPQVQLGLPPGQVPMSGSRTFGQRGKWVKVCENRQKLARVGKNGQKVDKSSRKIGKNRR